MESVERLVLAFLVNAAWQVTLVALVALACTRVLHRAPAAMRHGVLLFAFVASAAVPLLGAVSSSGTAATTAARVASQAGAVLVDDDPWSLVGFAPRRPLTLETGGWVSDFVALLFLAFVAVRAFAFARELLYVRRFRRATTPAAPFDAAARALVDRCARAIGARRFEVRVSDTARGPAAVGLLRPVVVIPTELWTTRDSIELEAALGHELAHVRRRDFAVAVACEFLYLFVAFHPLARLLKRRIDREREIACDEMVTASLVAPSTYARALVRLASSMANELGRGYALGISHAGNLEKRIMKLTSKTPAQPKRLARALAVAAVLAITSMSAAALPLSLSGAAHSNEFVLGTWTVRGTQDGDPNDKRDDDVNQSGHPEITFTESNGVLRGTVVFPKVIKTEAGPKVVDRTEVSLSNLVYDGAKLSFGVDNGEETLVGEVKQVDDHFEGRWISTKSKLSGTLTLTRKS